MWRLSRQPARSEAQDQEDVERANAFEFASANLHLLLPELPMAEHPDLIETIIANQALAAADETNCSLLAHTENVDDSGALARAKEAPAIFATFHFGSYRLINMMLASKGLSYVLPVDRYIFERDRVTFEKHFQGYKDYFHSASQLQVVNAEEPTSALAMARKARAGWSLLAYVDGNTGVQGTERQDSKLLKIPLLGHDIYARKGIAFLAHFLHLPLVPVFCEILGPTERRLTLHAPINPAESALSRDEFCRVATEKLHVLLGEHLVAEPAQWEGWFDLQKHLDLEHATSPGVIPEPTGPSGSVVARKLVFNHERYGILHENGAPVLLDKLTYGFFEIPANLHAVLVACEDPVRVSNLMSPSHKETIERLLALQLLVPAG